MGWKNCVKMQAVLLFSIMFFVLNIMSFAAADSSPIVHIISS